VRGTVEETLNALLDAEADRLCNAQRYERSAARRDTRAGHYERGLQTKAGQRRRHQRRARRRRLQLSPPPRMVEAFVAQNPDCTQPTRPAQIRLKSGSSRPTNLIDERPSRDIGADQ
jgi:hypothetical protein